MALCIASERQSATICCCCVCVLLCTPCCVEWGCYTTRYCCCSCSGCGMSQSAEHNRRAVLNAAFSPLSNFSESFRSQRDCQTASSRPSTQQIGQKLGNTIYGNPFGLEILGDLPLEMTIQLRMTIRWPTMTQPKMVVTCQFLIIFLALSLSKTPGPKLPVQTTY